jgi:enolase
MDVAASEFYKAEESKYDLDFKNPANDGSQKVTGAQLAEIYRNFTTNFPVVSIEDPFDQDDWDSYAALTESLGENV